MDRFAKSFSRLPDPRASNSRHELMELLFIALLATLSGAQSCCEIAEFAVSKHELLSTILRLEHGAPSHDTFSRVFRLLDPVAFEQSFRRFMKRFAKATKGVVALDGKALRRAYERGKSYMPPVMVTAWSAQTRMALANQLAPGGDETAAVLQLIKLLRLKGCVVTADALHCRPDTAKAIITRGGDYVIGLKRNRPNLLNWAKAAIAAARHTAGSATTRDARHGRKETRTAFVAPAPALPPQKAFPGLKAFALIRSRRGREKIVERYFVMTRLFRPAKLLEIQRSHWSIENRLHWTLDVVLDEDLARSRKDNAPANLAVFRRLALNIARAHPDTKTPLRRKLKRAGWNEAFLFDLIRHMR